MICSCYLLLLVKAKCTKRSVAMLKSSIDIYNSCQVQNMHIYIYICKKNVTTVKSRNLNYNIYTVQY